MRSYECAVIFDPTVGDSEVGGSAKRFARLIADEGGEMTSLETWGKRRLAYEIQHHAEGTYFFYKFRGQESVVKELDRQLKIDETVIRHMVVRDERAAGDEPAIAGDAIEVVSSGEPQEA